MFFFNFFREVFGGISHYETYEYEVIEEHDGWEVRKYPEAVAAVVSVIEMQGKRDSSFIKLARYIGVFSKPENKSSGDAGSLLMHEISSEGVAMTTPVVMEQEPEAIAMTTPVVMQQEPEVVAMTTPVVMSGDKAQSESVNMTTPVVMSSSLEEERQMSKSYKEMKFILPKKYKTVEDAPKPTNSEVRIELVPPRTFAAMTCSGRLDREQMEEKYQEFKPKIEASSDLEINGNWEGHFFNPPYTIGLFRRNDILVPVKIQGELKKKEEASPSKPQKKGETSGSGYPPRKEVEMSEDEDEDERAIRIFNTI